MKFKTLLLAAFAAFSFSANAVTILSNDFNAGLGGFTVDNTVGSAGWVTTSDNYTGGTGDATWASSDNAGPGAYDTSLLSTAFDLSGLSSANLSFLVNYQAFGVVPTNDNFDVDISTDGGTTWTTALAFEDDTPVGGLFAAPGVAIDIDLAAYLGETSVVTRWHYYNPDPSAFDWYAQIDDVLIEGMPAAPVAEPSSLALIGLGLIGVAALRRRRG